MDGKQLRNNTIYCRETKEIKFTLEVLCTAPRLIKINNVLSDYESQYIIDSNIHINMKRSTLSEAATIDNTRTSKTGWINRSFSTVIDGILRRYCLIYIYAIVYTYTYT